MSTETLRVARNVLYRCFLLGLALALLFAGILAAGWNTWMSLSARAFGTTEAVLVPVILSYLATIRFFLFFVLLTPALALHWTYKAEGKRKPGPPPA